jgi:hypothetical protein
MSLIAAITSFITHPLAAPAIRGFAQLVAEGSSAKRLGTVSGTTMTKVAGGVRVILGP